MSVTFSHAQHLIYSVIAFGVNDRRFKSNTHSLYVELNRLLFFINHNIVNKFDIFVFEYFNSRNERDCIDLRSLESSFSVHRRMLW